MEEEPKRVRRRHRRRRTGPVAWMRVIAARDLWLYPLAVLLSGAVAYWLLK